MRAAITLHPSCPAGALRSQTSHFSLSDIVHEASADTLFASLRSRYDSDVDRECKTEYGAQIYVSLLRESTGTKPHLRPASSSATPSPRAQRAVAATARLASGNGESTQGTGRWRALPG